MKLYSALTIFTTILFANGCQQDQNLLFHQLDADKTGIHFSNDIQTNDTLNAIYFEYIYNGGGVAASDLNGDGLVDLFFTGNQVSSKLYLNRGDLTFEDITIPAGVTTDRWCTGVAIADVNDDGKKDIYISVAGYKVEKQQMENLLFINQGWDKDGIPTFEESAAAYGLNDNGYSTQAAFFDYDQDGDLDLYLLTNALEKFHRNNLRPKRVNGEAESTDRLYRNNGDETFTNVSQEAGILIEGYGLGVQITDLNFDGLPDVYTANDFLSNDLIWMNNGDGTFSNKADTYLKHQTHNGMGVDIADFNNDTRPDIAVMDMLPEDNYRQKMMIPYVNIDKFWMKKKLGYQDQYMRNTVQLHQGFSADGQPIFSEIGNLTGMTSTDWSWAVLFADFDNDGWKDVYITNGYRKDVTNLDYINYSNTNQMFGTSKTKKDKAINDLENTQDVEVHNYLFHNKGTLEFENVSQSWGVSIPSYSNGAAYTDLDNDGDLDLVVNNIDAKAFLFENTTRQQAPTSNYLQIKLTEKQKQLNAYNTKVWVYTNPSIQYQEYSPFRGYKSTVDDVLHFGLGEAEQVDSLIVVWPDKKKTVLQNVEANQRINVIYEQGLAIFATRLYSEAPAPKYFQLANESMGIQFEHADNQHSDLKSTRTLPHDHSKAGPALATGDINGDGLDDFFVGGNKDQAGMFFTQSAAGYFIKTPFPFDSTQQDVDAVLFDADQDNDLDLYVVSGGTFAPKLTSAYQDRLYLNDGKGHFRPAPGALPEMKHSGSCVRPADFDQDGDIDLFVGGRVLPGQYPLAPRSYLLENQDGQFKDITPDSLAYPGLVTDAIWSDFNNDQKPDLIVVGEWMPISFFENQNQTLQKATITIDQQANLTHGWWMHINGSDLDQDGDIDYLVGNLGLNSKLKASNTNPVRLYAKDFDNNGAIDPLLACYNQGEEYLMHERDLLINQIPGMKRRFPKYSQYGEASVAQTLSPEDMQDVQVKTSYQFASVILENRGDYQFKIKTLPLANQLSPINGSLIQDLDQNGKPDILTAGNFHATETTQIGWYDASYGNILFQDTDWHFRSMIPLPFGLMADGDIRKVKSLHLGQNQTLVLFGIYGGALKPYIYRANNASMIQPSI